MLNNHAVCQEDQSNKSYYVDVHHPVVPDVNCVRKEGAVQHNKYEHFIAEWLHVSTVSIGLQQAAVL